MNSSVLLTALSGAGFGLSLIVAIGAQNAWVLRQGLRREHIGWVVLVCALSDIALISAGIGGMGALVTSQPWLTAIIRYAGAAFLLVYAFLAGRRAFGSSALVADATSQGAKTARAVITTTLVFTWLNPHTYLDTILLLGSIGSSYGDQRWVFGAGAITASLLWFTSLGFGSRLLSGVFAKPSAWRILDAGIAVVMAALGLRLLIAG